MTTPQIFHFSIFMGLLCEIFYKGIIDISPSKTPKSDFIISPNWKPQLQIILHLKIPQNPQIPEIEFHNNTKVYSFFFIYLFSGFTLFNISDINNVTCVLISSNICLQVAKWVASNEKLGTKLKYRNKFPLIIYGY